MPEIPDRALPVLYDDDGRRTSNPGSKWRRRMKFTTLSLVLVVVLAGILGCGTKEPLNQEGWTAVAEADLNPAQTGQLERAMEARKILFSRLSTELKTAMEESGPVSAISVCKDAAPVIAADVSREQGLRIGRTSFKLRNAANAPPEWAKPWVEKRVEDPTYLAGPEGQLGVLLPIRAQAACLTCHGTEDTVPGEVQAVVAKLYPNDQATGFSVEDLRGWFWIEVGS
jgi:predicted small lipoprotein YifL